MASAPSASWNSRCITHLANCPNRSLPTNSSDESNINGKFSRLAMKPQLEPVGQESLPHQPHLLRIGFGPWFGFDIVTLGIDPGRTSDHLRSGQREGVACHRVFVGRVRKLEKKHQGCV